jgi:hypothetical protein
LSQVQLFLATTTILMSSLGSRELKQFEIVEAD